MKNFINEERYHYGDARYNVATMIPTKLLSNLYNFLENDLDKYCMKDGNTRKFDGHILNLWCVNNNIKCLTTNPSLVQHLGHESLLGVKRIQISESYMQNPPVDGW